VSRDTNYIDVFYVTPAPNPMIMHVYWISGSGWSDPIIVASANVLPNTSIAAISRKSNTIEVFWVGNDYSIQHAYWYDTIGWAGPFALTNPNTVDGWSAQPDLAVVSRNPYDKLEVFFRGREMYQKLHHVYWSEGVPENGFWSGETQIPGSIYAASGKLAAISRASDAIEVFFHGTDYEVHHTYWDGSNWNNGGIVNASESRGDALGGIAAVTRASSSTQMEAWFPTPCSRALQASYTGSNFDFTRGCRARCAWREGGGLVGLARELSRSLGLESSLAERGVDLE